MAINWAKALSDELKKNRAATPQTSQLDWGKAFASLPQQEQNVVLPNASSIDWDKAFASVQQTPDVISPTARRKAEQAALLQQAQEANWMQPTVTAAAQDAARLEKAQTYTIPGATRLSNRRAQEYADIVNNAAEENTLNRLQSKIDNLTAQRGTEKNGYYYYDTPEGAAYLDQQLKEIEQVLRDQYGKDYELRGIQQAQDALDELNHDSTRELSKMQETLPMLQQYAELYDRPDFEKNSRYRTTKDPNAGAPEHELLTNYMYNTGYGDILYDYINGDPGAVEIQRFNDAALGLREVGMDKSFLEQMSDNEKKTFNYLYATQGADSAYEYIRKIQNNLTYRDRLEREAVWRQAAKEHPVAASLLSTVASPAKVISYVGQMADYLGDGKIDQNAGYNQFTQMPGTLRSQVSEDIREKGGELWGPVGSFLYNTGMSMADFLLNMGITGGADSIEALTLSIMGGGAAADAVVAAKDKGLSDDQAFALGTIAGAAEIITEKVSVEALLDTTALSKSKIGYFIKNLVSEGSEEVGSDFINLFSDILISKDQSEWRRSIDAKMKDGASEKDAFWQAFGEQAADMGLDFLGGALSGAAMAGGVLGIDARQDARYSSAANAAAQTMPFEVYQNILNQERNAAAETAATTATTEEATTNGSEPVAEPVEPAGAAVAEPETIEPVAEPAAAAESAAAEAVPAAAEPVAGAERADVVFGGGQGRGAAPADTGGPGTVDRAGTTVTPTIQQRYDTARERYSRWQQSGGTLTSTKALGLQDGTDTQNVMAFDDPASWDDEMKTVSRTWDAVASRVKEMYGADFNIRFVGGLTEVEIGGVTKQIVGVVDESGVTLNCTSGQYSLTQTSEHELFHTLCSMYPALEGEVFAQLMDSGAWEQMVPVLERLDAMYKALGYENSGDMAIEETMADIFSGINRFEEHDLSSLRDKAMQIVDEQTRTMAPAENWQPGARDRNPEGGPMYLRRVSQKKVAQQLRESERRLAELEGRAPPKPAGKSTGRRTTSIGYNVEKFMDEDTPKKYITQYTKAINTAKKKITADVLPGLTDGSNYAIQEKLTQFANLYYLNGFVPNEELDALDEFVRDLQYENDRMDMEYPGLRQYLRDQRIYMSESIRKSYGKTELADMRKKNFGRGKISSYHSKYAADAAGAKAGLSPDVVYHEIVEGWPGALPGDEMISDEEAWYAIQQLIDDIQPKGEKLDQWYFSGDPVEESLRGVAEDLRAVVNTMVDGLPTKQSMTPETTEARRKKAEARVEKELDEAWKAAYEGQRNASIEQRVTEAARVARNEAQAPARMEAFEAAREAIRSKTMEEVQKEAESGGLVQPPSYAENEKVQRSRKKRDFIGDLWYQALRANGNLAAQNIQQERADMAAAAASNAAAREAAEAAEPRINEAQGITREQLIAWGNRLPDSVLERVNNEWGGGIPEDLYEMMNQVAKDMPRRQNNYTTTRHLDEIGVAPAGSLANYWGVDSLIANDRAAGIAERQVQDAERRMNATEEEKAFARELANGTFTAKSIPAGVSLARVQELADYYAMRNALDEDALTKKRQELVGDYDAEIARIMSGKDLKPGNSPLGKQLEQNDRVIQNAFVNKEDGKAVYNATFEHVRKNGYLKQRWQNAMRDRVRWYMDSRGQMRELTNVESMLVHRVIEGNAIEYQMSQLPQREAERVKQAAAEIRDGKNAQVAAADNGLNESQTTLANRYAELIDTNEQLASVGSDSNAVIQQAVDRYRDMYNKLYEAINDFLAAHGYKPIGFIQDYAPHMQPEDTKSRFDKVMDTLGIRTDVKTLPEGLSGQTWFLKPYKRWDPHFMHRTGSNTEYNITKGFEDYIDFLGDIFYHTDDVMRTRSMSRYIKAMSDDQAPGAVTLGYQLLNMPTEDQRRYLENRGLLSTAQAVTPAEIRERLSKYLSEEEAKDQNDPYKSGRKREGTHNAIVNWLDEKANKLAGKQSMLDRGAEITVGRGTLNVGNLMNTWFKRAKTAGSFSSMLNNLSQLAISLPEFGPRITAQAVKDIVTGRLEAEDFTNMSDYLYEKKYGDSSIWHDNSNKVLDALYGGQRVMDMLMSQIVVRSAYIQGIEQGMTQEEAIKYADRMGEKIVGSRMKELMPLMLQHKNPLIKMITSFQVEPLQTYQYVIQDKLIDGIKDIRETKDRHGKAAASARLASTLAGIILSAFVMNRIGEETYGGTPAPFDILGWILDFIAKGQGVTVNDLLKSIAGLKDVEFLEDFDAKNAASETGYDIMSDLPFARNIAAFLGQGDQTLAIPQIGKTFDAVGSLLDNGLTLDTAEDFVTAAGEFMPGGSQIGKTFRGLRLMGEGGKYLHAGTEKEQLKYPVADTWENWMKAAMFGPYALEESQSYYAKAQDKRTSLSRSATADYRELTDAGMDRTDAYRLIKERNRINNLGKGEGEEAVTNDEKAEMKLEALDRANIPASAETAAYGVMMGSKQLSKMEGAGFETEDAYPFQRAVDEAEIANGEDTLSDPEIWQIAVNTYSDPAMQVAALAANMTDTQAAKMLVTTQYATPEEYVSFHSAYYAEFGTSYRQADVEAVLDRMPYTDDAKAAIWQSCNKGWSAKNNPYNPAISEQVKISLASPEPEQTEAAPKTMNYNIFGQKGA